MTQPPLITPVTEQRLHGHPVLAPGGSSRLLIILAEQRSGTTALSQSLNCLETIESLGEVFHAARSAEDDPRYEHLFLRGEANYFSYLERSCGADPSLVYPSLLKRRALFGGFCEYLIFLLQKDWGLVDIKYNSWHHFDPLWQPLDAPPGMIQLIREAKIPVLHVIRRDSLARYCSERLAHLTAQWHLSGGEERTPARMEIDPLQAYLAVKKSLARQCAFRTFFLDYALYKEVWYEEIFTGSSISRAAISVLEGLMSISINYPVRCPLRRINEDLEDRITNLESVRASLRDTDLGEHIGPRSTRTIINGA